MTTEKSYLTAITPTTPAASIKLYVKLLKKKDPISSSGKKPVQSYSFIDEMGTRRRGVAFGTDVAYFNRHLTIGCAYEIVNVLVKKVNEQYQQYINEVQVTLTRHTKIRLLNAEHDYFKFQPAYVPLSGIADRYQTTPFDIIVIVTKVNDPHQVTLQAKNLPTEVTDIFVTDDSIDDIVQLSMWRGLGDACQKISTSEACTSVTQFTCVKTTQFQARSAISSTIDTEIILNPIEQRADSLRLWANTNSQPLEARTAKIVNDRPSKRDISNLALADAIAKQASDVSKGDLIRVEACVQSFDNASPRTTFLCPRCSMPYHGPAKSLQQCEICDNPPTCTAKMFLDFTIFDGDAQYPLQAYPKAAEKLFRIKASDVHNMTQQEKNIFMTEALDFLNKKKVSFVLGPNASRLDDSAELQWELKYIADK